MEISQCGLKATLPADPSPSEVDEDEDEDEEDDQDEYGEPQGYKLLLNDIDECKEKLRKIYDDVPVADIKPERDIVVAVLDTGLYKGHSAFKSKTVKHSRDFVDKTTEKPCEDKHGHGTACAAIVLGDKVTRHMPADGAKECMSCKEHNNCQILTFEGIAPFAKLAVGKVSSDNNRFRANQLARGIRWAVSDEVRADIISISQGKKTFSEPVSIAIYEALKKGAIIVCAAANDGKSDTSTILYPAKLGNVISVGSHGSKHEFCAHTAIGREIDVLGPGEDVLTADLRGIEDLTKQSGTSVAAPYVAGICALLLAWADKIGVRKQISNTPVMKMLLKSFATQPGFHDQRNGFGSLKPSKLFQLSDRHFRLKVDQICHSEDRSGKCDSAFCLNVGPLLEFLYMWAVYLPNKLPDEGMKTVMVGKAIELIAEAVGNDKVDAIDISSAIRKGYFSYVEIFQLVTDLLEEFSTKKMKRPEMLDIGNAFGRDVHTILKWCSDYRKPFPLFQKIKFGEVTLYCTEQLPPSTKLFSARFHDILSGDTICLISQGIRLEYRVSQSVESNNANQSESVITQDHTSPKTLLTDHNEPDTDNRTEQRDTGVDQMSAQLQESVANKPVCQDHTDFSLSVAEQTDTGLEETTAQQQQSFTNYTVLKGSTSDDTLQTDHTISSAEQSSTGEENANAYQRESLTNDPASTGLSDPFINLSEKNDTGVEMMSAQRQEPVANNPVSQGHNDPTISLAEQSDTGEEKTSGQRLKSVTNKPVYPVHIDPTMNLAEQSDTGEEKTSDQHQESVTIYQVYQVHTDTNMNLTEQSDTGVEKTSDKRQESVVNNPVYRGHADPTMDLAEQSDTGVEKTSGQRQESVTNNPVSPGHTDSTKDLAEQSVTGEEKASGQRQESVANNPVYQGLTDPTTNLAEQSVTGEETTSAQRQESVANNPVFQGLTDPTTILAEQSVTGEEKTSGQGQESVTNNPVYQGHTDPTTNLAELRDTGIEKTSDKGQQYVSYLIEETDHHETVGQKWVDNFHKIKIDNKIKREEPNVSVTIAVVHPASITKEFVKWAKKSSKNKLSNIDSALIDRILFCGKMNQEIFKFPDDTILHDSCNYVNNLPIYKTIAIPYEERQIINLPVESKNQRIGSEKLAHNIRSLNRSRLPGNFATTKVSDGLNYTTERERRNRQPVDILVIPCCFEMYCHSLFTSIAELSAKGTIVVVPAVQSGTHRLDQMSFPARYGDVLVIGNCDDTGQVSSESARGREVDFLLPAESPEIACVLAADVIAFVLSYVEDMFEEEGKKMRRAMSHNAVMRHILREYCSARPGNHDFSMGFGELDLGDFIHLEKDDLRVIIEKEVGKKTHRT